MKFGRSRLFNYTGKKCICRVRVHWSGQYFCPAASSVLSLGSINGFNIRVGVSRFCSAKQVHFLQSYRAKYIAIRKRKWKKCNTEWREEKGGKELSRI